MGRVDGQGYHGASGVVPEPVVFGPVVDGVAVFLFEVDGDGTHHRYGVVAMSCDVLLGDLLKDDWVEDEP